MRFFSERGVQVQNTDLEQKPPGRREIELFIQVAGAEALIDQDSTAYRSRGVGYMEFDPIDELAEIPVLLRTPIVRIGRTIIVGEDEAGWRRVADAASAHGASTGEGTA